MQPRVVAARLPRVVAAACTASKQRSGSGSGLRLEAHRHGPHGTTITPSRTELPAEGCVTSSCHGRYQSTAPCKPHLKAVLRQTLLDQQPQQERQ